MRTTAEIFHAQKDAVAALGKPSLKRLFEGALGTWPGQETPGSGKQDESFSRQCETLSEAISVETDKFACRR